jgi:hypothetical protein
MMRIIFQWKSNCKVAQNTTRQASSRAGAMSVCRKKLLFTSDDGALTLHEQHSASRPRTSSHCVVAEAVALNEQLSHLYLKAADAS